MNLYEINRQIEECLTIDEATGEVTFNEDLMASLQMERDQKIENLALYIKNLTAEASAIKAEKLVLAERQRRAEAKAERLKAYLSDALGGEKFSSPRVAISWRKSERLEIDEEVFMANGNLNYCRQKLEPDKTLIKDALKMGIEIDGAALMECRTMQIR